MSEPETKVEDGADAQATQATQEAVAVEAVVEPAVEAVAVEAVVEPAVEAVVAAVEATIEAAAVEPAAVEPAAVEPAAVEPAAVEPVVAVEETPPATKAAVEDKVE